MYLHGYGTKPNILANAMAMQDPPNTLKEETYAKKVKCRGKRKDNNEWVYGQYESHFIIDEQGNKFEAEFGGQYTGKKDKRGIEIYTGDMIDQAGNICGNIHENEL